ncbi:alpha/beta hydrolase [Gallaecimonas kandeliae]|uniref:alpha/beta fold hydrolase n=1 Tax=Gallaecimonas kandeliae TaxID=3029055 RepID=UPI002649E7B5|nr:alpha/beta hydrolase [Gallaecimonas kandeliae]WKE67114.1 alpha/beta hydrolase [Gallaecimonas kandeliae]
MALTVGKGRSVASKLPLVAAALLFILGIALARAAPSLEQYQMEQKQQPVRTGYAPVNGLRLYFEIHGAASSTQPPLVLLHGGGDTIQTSFGQLLPALARQRQMIAFEQQGYGHTADIKERPFSFEQSTDDTAALLDYLHVEQADLLGFSNGGTIALLVASRYPHRVRKLVLLSALLSRDGAYPWLWEAMDNARLENMPKELQQAYLAVAPEPGNLRLMHDKAAQRVRDFKDIPADTVRAVRAPTLVVIGDSDVIRPEHAVESFRRLPQAQLAILPGTNHMQVTSHGALAAMVAAFLDSPLAK